jgi:dihydrofolate reductase
MRKVTFGVASSLDNFIARENHAVDWLAWTDEIAAITATFWKTIDTVVMGRKTYEIAAKMGTRAYPGVRNIVFSRTMAPTPGDQVEIVSADASRFLRRLKASSGKGICVMGGGELAKSFFEAGLIDEIGLNIHPVLLGKGIPLFLLMEHQIDLQLLECRPLKNGCVFVRYAVKQAALRDGTRKRAGVKR